MSKGLKVALMQINKNKESLVHSKLLIIQLANARLLQGKITKVCFMYGNNTIIYPDSTYFLEVWLEKCSLRVMLFGSL